MKLLAILADYEAASHSSYSLCILLQMSTIQVLGGQVAFPWTHYHMHVRLRFSCYGPRIAGRLKRWSPASPNFPSRPTTQASKSPPKLPTHRPSFQPTSHAPFHKAQHNHSSTPPPPQCMLSQGVGSSQQTDSCRRSHTQLEAVLPQPRGEGQEVGPPLHHPAGHRCGGLEDGQMNLWQLPTRLLLCFQHCHHRRTCVGSLSTASLSGKTQALRHTSVVLSVSLKPACSAGDCSVRKPTSRILPLIF